MTSTLVLLLLFLLVLPSKGLNPLSSLSRRAALSTATTTLISTSLPQQELPTPPYDPTQQYPRSLFSYTLLPLTSTLQGNIPTIESIIIPDKLITHTQLIGANDVKSEAAENDLCIDVTFVMSLSDLLSRLAFATCLREVLSRSSSNVS
ncbi:hypothetical protein TL16_g09523 [Triparma laevis f. inornata]|uniref:Uncharacterized protein n=1 Tax=Triparma laevis f. inornata TaxID=1714386 RepID=A0A9W7EMH3_9STRA|nr:hypothetical protein TL16_g09523 [Triparma laevis f. inornata]